MAKDAIAATPARPMILAANPELLCNSKGASRKDALPIQVGGSAAAARRIFPMGAIGNRYRPRHGRAGPDHVRAGSAPEGQSPAPGPVIQPRVSSVVRLGQYSAAVQPS